MSDVLISPKPVIESESPRMRLIDQWKAWSAECDVDGQTDFYDLQTLALRAMLESGECLAALDTGTAAAIPPSCVWRGSDPASGIGAE